MAATTIKMGKRGTIVIPAKLRKQFGLEDGSLLNVSTVDGKIYLAPAFAYEPEVWTAEEKSYFLLINSLTKEEWDRNIPHVLALGVDPSRIDGLAANHRNCLPTEAEWNAKLTQTSEKLSA